MSTLQVTNSILEMIKKCHKFHSIGTQNDQLLYIENTWGGELSS